MLQSSRHPAPTQLAVGIQGILALYICGVVISRLKGRSGRKEPRGLDHQRLVLDNLLASVTRFKGARLRGKDKAACRGEMRG